MVKNIPTIERSTKIRFGKHVSDSQAENTIVFNASNTEISTPNSGSIYMSPLRVENVDNANFFAYNSTTKEVVDSGVKTSLLGGITLQEATSRGNTTSNIVQFTNSTTGFITTSNVGISNSAPTHALSVKDKIFMCGPGTTLLEVKGTSKSERIISGTNITIDGVQTGTNPAYITTGGRTHSTRFTGTTLGLAGNLVPTDTISLGNDPSSVKINVPTQSTNAFWTSGNVYAQKYLGDGSLLDNITMDVVSRKLDGNILSIPIESSNIITGIKTLGNVQVDTTNGSFLGKIAGSNTISASTISATSISTTSAIATTSGGTGYSTYESGAILYGKSDNSLGKLDPASSNEDVGKFLKLGTNDVPTWSEVSSNLESIVSNGPTSANITSNTIQFRNDATSLMTTGNIVVGTNVYAEEFVSTNIPIASTSGGTGHKVITKGDILYGNHDSDNTLGRLIKAVDDSDRGKFLKLGTNDIPTWSEVSSNLESIVSNGPITANITSNILQFSQGIQTKDITIGSGSQINDTFIPYLDSGSKLLKSSKISYNDTDKITSISSNVVIGGNLTVQGNTTHEHITDHFITDKIFAVSHGNDKVGEGGNNKDMGQHMARPEANVFSGYLGATSPKEYTICFTTDASTDETITPNNGTSDGYITANVWGNVLSGNVTSTGLIHGGTLKGDGSAITVLNMGNAGSGTLAVNRGGTGATTLNDLITLGTHTTGNYVTSITGGDGITAGAAAESGTPTVTIDAKTNGGLVIESNKLAVKLDASSITGTLAIGDGGTGQTTASAAASALGVGTEDSPQFTGIELGHASDTTLARSSAGVVTIEGAEIRTGTVAIGKGGTGQTTASAAASALGVGAEDSPSFVTVNANVNAGNVTSESIKLTNPGIIGTFNTQTITINAKNRTYGTTPLVVINGDLESLYFTNLINGAQIVVPILATGADRAVSKDLTNVNFTVITDDVSITQNKHALMTLSNISGNIYMNTIAFS
jgi:hypothetical protein